MTVPLDEAFAGEDPQFLALLRETHDLAVLAAVTERWVQDSRPWARQQIASCLQEPLEGVEQLAIVKRLFRHAETTGDDELMGWFLLAFDRSVRFERRRRWRWDGKRGPVVSEEYLALPRVTRGVSRATRLTLHTRYYLRRRTWRYFRRMAFQRPVDYAPAVSRALARYTDDDLARGEDLLECWGLMHACFGEHPAVTYNAVRFTVRPESTLAELQPVPCFPQLWETDDALAELLRLVDDGQSRLVRMWAGQMLELRHAPFLSELKVAQILPLMHHADKNVQQFAGRVFRQLKDLDAIPVETWLHCLETSSVGMQEVVGDLLPEHLHGDRLSLEDLMALACAAPTQVSQWGLHQLRQRTASPSEQPHLVRAALCRCASTAAELTHWVLSHFQEPTSFDRHLVSAFFEAQLPETRAAAWNWLCQTDGPAQRDAALWTQLVQTPHDDLRLWLIDHLHRHTAPLPLAALTTLWAAVLLDVDRGGRHKLKVVEQVRNALRSQPELADLLLPLLATAAGSSRAPERRAGLSALAAVLTRRPEWQDRVQALLPELQTA